MGEIKIVYGRNQKIDSKDRKIMKILFEDGRMSIADIANATNIRRDSVARRMKRLVKEQIITGFVPIINPPALGLPNLSQILIRMKSIDAKDRKTFQNRLVGIPFILHISKLIGKYDYICAVIYENTNHLNTIVEQIKTFVPNSIEEIEVYSVVEEPKFEKMDELL